MRDRESGAGVPSGEASRAGGAPPWVLATIGAVLIWIYAHRIAENPLVWEEPRRCLVALEMIHGEDYLVPRVYGEPYRNKPPLQNWWIVLLAGNRAGNVGPLVIRSISLLSVAGTAALLLLLWRRVGPGRATAWLPAAIFVSLGVIAQYGRFGELDLSFTLWVVAAFAAFEIGRQRGAPWVQWTLSQTLLAGGVLTKGLAPFFFYPPALFHWWRVRGKAPFAWLPFLAGLGLELLLVAAWVVPYSVRTSAAALGTRLSEEVLQRTPLQMGAAEFFLHLGRFPLEVLANALPWSLLLLLWLVPAVRRALTASVRETPLLRLSAVIFFWAFLVLWLMPGAKGRYMIPAYPFLVLLLAQTMVVGLPLCTFEERIARTVGWLRLHRPVGWAALAALIGLGAAVASRLEGRAFSWPFLLAASAAVLAAGSQLRRPGAVSRVSWTLLLSGLLYGSVFAGFLAVRQAEKSRPLILAAQRIAAAVDRPLPLFCDPELPFGAGYSLVQALGRPLRAATALEGPGYLISYKRKASVEGARLVSAAGPFELWQIGTE